MASGFDLRDEFKNAYKKFILSRGVEEEKVIYFLFWMKPVSRINELDINQYLEYLAMERKVSASSQNQALNALVFLFKNVFCRAPGDIGEFKSVGSNFYP